MAEQATARLPQDPAKQYGLGFKAGEAQGVRDTLARLTTDDAVTAWTRAVMSRGAGPGEDPMEVTRDRLGQVAAVLAPRITNKED